MRLLQWPAVVFDYQFGIVSNDFDRCRFAIEGILQQLEQINPSVLEALNPLYSFRFLIEHGWHGFLIHYVVNRWALQSALPIIAQLSLHATP